MGRQPIHRPRAVLRRQSLRKRLADHGIKLPQHREVNAYLREHPDLSELALVLCEEARREFGDSTELSLELYHDPEFDDSYLTLYVRQSSYEPDILPRIHRVGEAHAKEFCGNSGHILVTTDFRSPTPVA